MVAVLALVLAAAGGGLHSSLLDTAETVRGDFEEITATIPLPPGAAWSDPNCEDEGGHHASSLRGYDAAIAEMKRGEPTLVRRHLRANC